MFEAVKESVPTRQAAEFYGGQIGRNGMACCPFHDDKHPSMKVDRRFHCFGCQAAGGVINFTARLFGLNKKEAALKLAEDFSVHYDAKGHDPPRRRPVRRKISEELRYRQAEQKCFRVLCDYLHIAITDGVDSLTRQEMDITPFKNILNDMYSRDISKKVLAGRMTRSRQGKFCGGQPPLGLMRDPEDKGHLILDPETAPVIRKIYDLALDGWGCMRIAKQLMDDKIPITRVKSNTECDVNYYSWGSARISHILRNSFYKGAHLVCRTHQKGIRSNTYDIIPREEWEVIEGCHEAIVTPEEWEQVQELIDRRPTIMKGNACPFYNLFHGLVYCATCGKSMQVRYEKVGRTGKNRFTGEMREPIDRAYYICQTYNRLGKNACTSHKIEARDLYNLVLKDIQELAAQAMKDADAFYQRLSSWKERRYLVDASQTEKERKRLEARNQEIDGMFLSLYTDKAKGILTEQRFMKLTAALEQEQESNQKRLHDLAVMQSRADAQESEVRTFIKEIRRYSAIEVLDEAVLNRLISKILIGEVKKVDGQKVQEVRIVYNFVGEISEIAT